MGASHRKFRRGGLHRSREETRSIYAVGMEKPPAGGKRAGRYFARVQSGGDVEVISRQPQMAASGVVAINDDIALLESVSSDTNSSAVFSLLDKDGRERWQHVAESQVWNNPVSIVRHASGFVLLSIESDFSLSSAAASVLVVTLVLTEAPCISSDGFPSLCEFRHRHRTVFSLNRMAM